MTDDKIPGTRVPETPIHRASLWLEGLKFGDRRAYVTEVEPIEPDDRLWQDFITGVELRGVTVEQLKEAASYYGENMLQMTFGNRLNVMMPTPDGKGVMDLRMVFISLWLDAFQHGAATKAGKYGLSNTEIANG